MNIALKGGKIMAIKTVGVVGAGAMGSGIANVAALSGFSVILRDIDDKYVQSGLTRIE